MSARGNWILRAVLAGGIAVALCGTAHAGMVKTRYAYEIPEYSTYVWGTSSFISYTAENGRTRVVEYGDRVRLRVTRLSGEQDRNRADTLTIRARVGSGQLPLVIEWLLAADTFFGTGDSTCVTAPASLLDKRFVRAPKDSSLATFLLKITDVDSSEAVGAAPREQAIRRAIADAREGSAEDVVEALRSLPDPRDLPLLARCALAGALEETGRCTACAHEQVALAREGLAPAQPESLLIAQCRRTLKSRASESQKLRNADSSRNDADWFGGDQEFLEVRVRAVRDSAATNADPPRVTLEIEHVLRGAHADPTRIVRWPGSLPAELRVKGQEQRAAQWPSWERKGPPVGARFVLGVAETEDGEWISDPLLRWTAAEAEEQDVRGQIDAATPRVEERLQRERPAKDAARRTSRGKRAMEESARVARESAWLETDRRARGQRSLEDLVRASDGILLARAPVGGEAHYPWGRVAGVTPRSWLRTPEGGPGDWTGVSVLIGAREDSLCAHWLAMPPDAVPGSATGDTIECVVFLADAVNLDRGYRSSGMLRLADPVAGVLRADSATVAQVRAALARRGAAPTEPAPGCGASLDEFSALTTTELAGVAVKLTSVQKRSGQSDPETVVLSCARDTILDAGWFLPCTKPDAPYASEYLTETRSNLISVERMRELLDALGGIPEIARGRVDPADPWTLTLRRVVNGEERIFETTLDGPASRALSLGMATIFGPSDAARPDLRTFWALAARSTVSEWIREAPHSVAPAPRAPRPGLGSVVGILVDGATELPVPGAIVRVSDPTRSARTDEAGRFALADLPPGSRWLEIHGGYGPQIRRIALYADSITTVAVRVGPEHATTRALRKGAVAPALPLTLTPKLSWKIRVLDEKGHPIPDAYAALADSSRLWAGLTDSSGIAVFAPGADARRWVFVRAAHRRAFRAHAIFEPGVGDTMIVRL